MSREATVASALQAATATLARAGIDTAARDARRIMAASLGVAPGRITLHLPDALEPEAEAAFFAQVEERARRRPLAHLLGGREFYGRWFIVTGDVLDPRDDTETLVEAALSGPFGEVLDLGTGSGCILLNLLAERPGATGTGSDLSRAALAVAERNAQALGVAGRCTLVQSDWFGAIRERFDLIVANPPYIAADEMQGLQPELAHEPRGALTDGGDGQSAYRAITAGAGAHLVPGGRLMVEIGWKQGPDVAQMFRAAGFHEVAVLPDLEGRDRVVTGRWTG